MKKNNSDDEELKDNNNKDILNNGIIKRLTKDEKLEKDKIKLKVFKSFVENMDGYHIPITIILFLLLMACFKSSSDIFLGYWSSHQLKEKNNNYFFIYSLLCLVHVYLIIVC